MPQKLKKTFIVLGAAFAALYPQWIWFQSVTFPPTSAIQPAQAWGLLAFAIMWLHIVAGPFRAYLDTLFPNYQKWISLSTLVVLFSLFAHPLLMLAGYTKLLESGFLGFFAITGFPAWAGVIAWPMLLQYDIARGVKKRRGIRPEAWYAVTLIATLGWFVILYHSLSLGSHLQSGPLRMLWYFMGATATVATIRNYFIKPLRQRQGPPTTHQ